MSFLLRLQAHKSLRQRSGIFGVIKRSCSLFHAALPNNYYPPLSMPLSQFRHRFRCIPLLLAPLLLAACIRYTSHYADSRGADSRGADSHNGNSAAEPASSSSSSTSSTTHNNTSSSDSDFFALDREQERRLSDFLARRRLALRGYEDNPYQIGVGDVLEVTVMDAPELSAKVTVGPEGMIDLPVVGSVPIAGLTEDGAREELVERYRTYVIRPDVNLTVSEYNAHIVSVLGEVGKPGNVALQRHHTDLLEVLSQAGGRTPRASARVTVIPAGFGSSALIGAALPPSSASLQPSTPTQEVHADKTRGNDGGVDIDIDDLLGTGAQDPMPIHLLSGDSVILQQAGSVQVDGDVARPGSYPLSERTSILGAVAAAGGLSYSADVNAVEVIRDLGDGRKVVKTFNLEDIALKGARDVRLRNADVVRVPSTTGKFVTRQISEVINRVLNFGFTRRVGP